MSAERRTPYLVRVSGSGEASQALANAEPERTRWQRVKEILDQALEVPLHRRQQVIADLCGGDTKLQEEVKEYLGYLDRAEDLLNDEADREREATEQIERSPASAPAAKWRGKFERAAAVAAIAGAAAIAIWGVALWREKQDADMRFQRARELVHSLVFEIDSAIAGLPESSHARQLLISKTLQYLDGVAKTRNHDSGVGLELAQDYMKIAALQSNLPQASGAEQTSAFATYSKARELLVKLRALEPKNRQVEISLALVDGDMASLAPADSRKRAEYLRRESVNLFADIARNHDGPSALKDIALAHFYLALAKSDEGSYENALPLWKQVLSDYQALAARDKNSAEDERNLGLVDKHIANVYFALGDYANALEYDRKAAEIDESRAKQQPQDATARADLSFDLVQLARSLHELRQDGDADIAISRAVELRRQMADQDPNDFHAHSELESVLRNAGILKSQAGNPLAAIPLLQEAASTGTALHDHDPHNREQTMNAFLDHYELGEVLRKLALQLGDRQSWQAALSAFAKAQAFASQLSGTTVSDTTEREKLGALPERIAECSRRTKPQG